jgi:hypothetical protein
MRENQQKQQTFIQFINYVWYLLHVLALHCHLHGAFLVPSERCSIEEQSILISASQFSISQKLVGTLPEDGNLRPKQVGATVQIY